MKHTLHNWSADHRFKIQNHSNHCTKCFTYPYHHKNLHQCQTRTLSSSRPSPLYSPSWRSPVPRRGVTGDCAKYSVCLSSVRLSVPPSWCQNVYGRNMLAIFTSINLQKLDKFYSELTSCRSLAQLTFPFSRRAIASQRCLSLQPTGKYTWSHYLWQDNRGLLLKKSTGNIGVKVVSIITSPSTPVFDVMLMILFHKTVPKLYFQIILMMSKLLGVWVQHLFIALVTCCN